MEIDLRNRLNRNFNFEPIQYHDTWLSIDPVIGCNLNCQYCYLRLADWTGVTPQKILSVEEIISMLQSHRYFIPHQTSLGVGTTTDIFLPENKGIAVEIAKGLDQRGYTNPLIFITKKLIPLEAIIEFKQIRHVRLIFILSYSGLPASVEKGVNPKDSRENFKRLAEHNLSPIHYWRPLITLNGTDEKINEILDFVVQYASSSIYVGLRYNPALLELYKNNENLRFTETHQNRNDEHTSSQVEQKLRKIATEKYPEYPLYKHTSCAISNLLNHPDYNATIYNKPVCLINSKCPSKQRAICQSAKSIPTEERVRALLDSLKKPLNFRVTEGYIEIQGLISQQDFSYLLHNLNYPIKAEIELTRIWRGSILRDNGVTTNQKNFKRR
jgi:DNA repair photolyase